MRTLYDIPAPAKLNLFLHITGRRDDGYHLMQSVFMLIDWCDTLHLERNSNGRIARTAAGNTAEKALPDDDLCVRAARLLQQHVGCPLGVDITLHKRIPVEAGMGGGSSDAASCLIGLNRLWGLGLSMAELSALGLELGADVPFFIQGRNAWVEGTGERITPLELPAARFLVVKPTTGIATPELFSHPDLTRNHKSVTMEDFRRSYYRFGCNDMQAIAERVNPDIARVASVLQVMGLRPVMTGSGSSVFAHVADASGDRLNGGQGSGSSLSELARRVVHRLPECTVKVCGNLPVHPLIGWLERQ